MDPFRNNRLSSEFPPAVKNLLIINILVFFLQKALLDKYNFDLSDYLGLQSFGSKGFNLALLPVQIITYMFLHGSWEHLFFNMFSLWMFGRMVEAIFNSKKSFIQYYLICGVGAGIIQLIVQYIDYNYIHSELLPVLHNQMVSTVGASGAIFGILYAFAYFMPNAQILIYFVLPVKAKYWIVIYAIIEFYSGVNPSALDNVAHFAHLGGLVAGFFALKYMNRNNYRRF